MKFENMVIHCENQYEKEKVISVLKNNNCKHWDSFLKDGNYIAVYPETPSFTIYKENITASDDVFYKYQQFMEKYGMSDLKSKVEEAKTKLGLSNQELSIKLGHQKRYITNALLDQSVKRKKEIILKIEALMLKESGELTHDFEGKALNNFIDDAVMVSKAELESLKKEISHKTQVAEKHADMRAKAEADLQIADEAIKQQLENVASKLLIIGKLEHELKEKDELINLTEEEIKKIERNYDDLLGRNKTIESLNIDLEKSKSIISIWLAISILIIVLMAAYAVLNFNGVV